LKISAFLKAVCGFACIALCIAGCSRQAQNSPSGAISSKGVVVMGEHFNTREIVDHQQKDLIVGVVAVPEKWSFTSNVVWNYANTSNPVTISMNTENPANSEAVFSYPPKLFFYLRPTGTRLTPGQNDGGLIFSGVGAQSPLVAFTNFIRQTRADVQNLQFVGSKNLPDLPAALKLAHSPNQRGLGVKVTYDLDGKPVEEEFYTVFDLIEIPYDGPQGRTYQINWGLEGLHSFRAPVNTLDKRRPVFAAIAKSFRPNPAWQKRQAAVNAYLADQFNRQLKAGYDAIAAAGRLSRQLSENSDAFLASVDRQLQSQSASGSGSAEAGEARSSADKFDDYIRGVDTVDDPYYGTSQQSNNQQFHWTDGYGSYRNTNDASYDPNQSENGAWQLMKNVP
jgi:hypothetical protein